MRLLKFLPENLKPRNTVLLGLLLIAASGCKFGNKEVDVVQAIGGGLSGFYETAPQQITFYSTHQNSTVSKPGLINQIPTNVSSVLSDPIMVLQNNGDYQISSPTNPGDGYVLNYDQTANNQISGIEPPTSSAIFTWADPNCLISEETSINGNIDPGGTPLVISYPQPEAGRVTLVYQYLQTIVGCSAADLQLFANCYSDSTQCGSDPTTNLTRQSNVQALFGPYVAADVMASTDIAAVSSIGYEIQYQ
jgi:hypothetical protein